MNYNVIKVTPKGEDFIAEIQTRNPLTKRRYSQQLPLRQVRSNSKASTGSKELDYYVNQKISQRMIRNYQQSLIDLETIKQNNDYLTTSRYMNRKLDECYKNMNFTDEQKHTYCQKLTKIALKHRDQIEQIKRIQEDVNKRHQQLLDKSYEKVLDIPEIHSGSTSILRIDQHKQNTLTNYHRKKYQQFWEKMPKTLVH